MPLAKDIPYVLCVNHPHCKGNPENFTNAAYVQEMRKCAQRAVIDLTNRLCSRFDFWVLDSGNAGQRSPLCCGILAFIMLNQM